MGHWDYPGDDAWDGSADGERGGWRGHAPQWHEGTGEAWSMLKRMAFLLACACAFAAWAVIIFRVL